MSIPSKYQVLVVDDDPTVRESFAMLLQSGGYDVQVAEDGFSALLQLRKLLPDVIISDLNMPRMSGFEFLSVVRRRFPEISTVAMTGACDGDDLPPGAIADAFYPKGGNVTKLFRILENLFGTSGRRSHHRELGPAWIPRNGNTSRGLPCVVVTCAECLRTFEVTVAEELAGEVVQVRCHFCPTINEYIIEPSISGGRKMSA